MHMNHYEAVAARKLGVPEGWQWFRYESVGTDATMLTGCVSSGTFTKGKRKGRPRYDGARRTAVVTDAEAQAERDRYQTDTGKCGDCMGTGQGFARWDHIEGASYRPCRVCNGSGQCLRA